ncbi:MAG: VOC family protein [Rhodospirillaceae bacterium]|nr:VOC family protein [Rhodospirillaceae bacterium]
MSDLTGENNGVMSGGWYMRRCPDGEAVEAFYRDGLGLPIIRKHVPVWFLWGGGTLAFELKADKAPRPERIIEPDAHPLTPILLTRDLKAALARAQAAGGKVVPSRDVMGREAFVLDGDRQITGLRQVDEKLPHHLATPLPGVAGDFNPGCPPLPADLVSWHSVVRRVRDVAKVAAFYRDVIGFKHLGAHGGREVFRIGQDMLLEIAPGGSPQVAPVDRGEITNSWVSRVADHNALMRRLMHHKVRLAQDVIQFNSARLVYVLDPEDQVVGLEERYPPEKYQWASRTPFPEDTEALRRFAARP